MVKKNDIIDLTIEDLGVNGEGIGKVDGYTLFVKDGVIGDEVMFVRERLLMREGFVILKLREVRWNMRK